MKKTNINLIIDALMLLCMAAVVGIGFLIKFILVPGYRRWQIYNSNVELYFWNMDRHQWGAIHLVVGIILLMLLILHIVLHWNMVVAIYCKLIPNTPLRYTTAVLFIFVIILLTGFAYFVKPDVRQGGRGLRHGRNNEHRTYRQMFDAH